MSKKPYCYITYPVPMEALASLKIPREDEEETREGENEFRVKWYLNASFPEDED